MMSNEADGTHRNQGSHHMQSTAWCWLVAPDNVRQCCPWLEVFRHPEEKWGCPVVSTHQLGTACQGVKSLCPQLSRSKGGLKAVSHSKCWV